MLGICLGGWAAAAGVVIEQEQREPGSEEVLARTVYYMDAGWLRLETKSEEGEDVVILFRADQPLAWIIDRTESTYSELTPAKVAQMRQEMDQARKELETQLAQMPPEQRRAIEQILGDRMGTPATTVRLVGSGERVGSFLCTRYEVLRGGQRRNEVWAAPVEQLQLRPEEYETFLALGRLFAPLEQRGPLNQLSGLPGGETIPGFPVRSLTYDGGRPIVEERVVRVQRRELEASLFELPPGLRRTEIGPGK